MTNKPESGKDDALIDEIQVSIGIERSGEFALSVGEIEEIIKMVRQNDSRDAPSGCDDKHELDLHVALSNLLDRYTQLVNCGDCGNWNPELEDEVIEARKALGDN